MVAMVSFFILVGTWSTAISTLRFTDSPASLTFVSQTGNLGTQPSWLTPNPVNSSIIYSTIEAFSGQILSLTVDKSTGTVKQVSSVSSSGNSPVHINVLPSGTELEAVNYGSGTAFNVQLESDMLHFKNPTTVQFTGSGPASNQASPHPHEVVPYNNELFIPDLGSDKVWRLSRSTTGTGWYTNSSISHPAGSGPRHAVALPGALYTIHEMANTVTQHVIPPLGSTQSATLVANISITPSDTSPTAVLAGGELIYSPAGALNSVDLLYASNRNDPHPNGDAIVVFSLNPLTKVATIRTGLQHIRAMSFAGQNNKYILAAGLNGGGVKVFERVNDGRGLNLVATLNSGQVVKPTSLLWVT